MSADETKTHAAAGRRRRARRRPPPTRPRRPRRPRPRPRRPRSRRVRRTATAARSTRACASATTTRSCRRCGASSATPIRCRSRGSRRSSSTSAWARRSQNAKALDAAVGDLTTITGQKPIVTRAKRSIAQFRLRTGMPIGAKVTLRGQRMYDFLERTMRAGAAAHPRLPRDRRPASFDGRGNFSLGLREQLVYPGDRLRQDRPAARAGDQHRDHGARPTRRGASCSQLLGMPFQATASRRTRPQWQRSR